ncbi:hypothetical protein FRC17_000665 [Serendipita sp. 399]|nr:hypothetical protein FRC17_000665 [Serendipita sp. 399]
MEPLKDLVRNLAMLLRVIALWSRSQLVKTIVICLFFANTLFYTVSAFEAYIKGGGGIPQPVSPFTGCIPQTAGRIPIYAIFIMALVFETTIVFFTVLKSYHLFVLLRIHTGAGTGKKRQPGHQSRGTTMVRLSEVLFNDGIVYYIAVILSHTISLYAAATPIETNPTVYIPIVSAGPAIAATTVACNRLFLRLHDVILTRKNWDDTTYRVADRTGDGTCVVPAGVPAPPPMGPSLGGSSRSEPRSPPVGTTATMESIQFTSRFGTVDYDYHDYLR